MLVAGRAAALFGGEAALPTHGGAPGPPNGSRLRRLGFECGRPDSRSGRPIPASQLRPLELAYERRGRPPSLRRLGGKRLSPLVTPSLGRLPEWMPRPRQRKNVEKQAKRILTSSIGQVFFSWPGAHFRDDLGWRGYCPSNSRRVWHGLPARAQGCGSFPRRGPRRRRARKVLRSAHRTRSALPPLVRGCAQLPVTRHGLCGCGRPGQPSTEGPRL
jgi:hypothetical protein